MTELKKFSEAYATMTVAVYEPLIVNWVSCATIATTADTVALRLQKARRVKRDPKLPTALAARAENPRRSLPVAPTRFPVDGEPTRAEVADVAGYNLAAGTVRSVSNEGNPDAIAVDDSVYPQGVLKVRRATEEAARSGILGGLLARLRPWRLSPSTTTPMAPRTLPTFLSGQVGRVDPDFDLHKARNAVFTRMMTAVQSALADRNVLLGAALIDSLRNLDPTTGTTEQPGETPAGEPADPIDLPVYLPDQGLNEALSPIGIAHYYRQLYFNIEEGVGPIEQAFTIAPLETLEVVYETVLRQVHEELVEVGLETVSETASETKNLDEVSDKVSSMVQRDSSAGMSANASGSIGVWQVGASATASMSVASERSREEASRRLTEVTKRASERITKSFSVKTRDIQESTTTHLTRRVIKNEAAQPVSYGLRRVLRRVNVKIQDMGPRLVWQLYVRTPGAGIGRSRFVHFREAQPISVPEIPPGVPPRPTGGTDTGSTSGTLAWSNSRNTYFVTLVVQVGGDREVTAISIDSISDLEGGGKDNQAPSPRNNIQWDKVWDESTNTYTAKISVSPGDSSNVSVSYTYSWDPSQGVLDAWEVLRQAAVAKLTEDALNQQFEREKALITERSKIRPRPANDLRREERYEVMNRMVSHLFARGDDPSDPTPLEIEYFHRFFEIDGMFSYTHPSWWKPRYAPVASGFGRPAYEITAESEPAPMGVSLGWMIQLDGDTRRNEFLNSPWVRVCIPIRPRRERDAIEWLAKHVEGNYGYQPDQSPLRELLEEISSLRDKEQQLGVKGPEYVRVDSTVGAPDAALKPENIYPIIDEFNVTVPTDGFVYDNLTVTIP